VVVIGDLLLDIVIPPRSAPLSAPDVVGEVQFRQGGSASTTARWLARLGMPTSLIASVGRDVLGDALVSYMERCKVRVHAVRPPRLRTGRMVVLLDHKGERSFVADRRAALALSAPEIRRAWFRGARALHAPAYCLFGEPLASATRYAVELAKENGAFLSVDLASASFIVAHGSHHVHDEVAALKPEVLVGTAAEARALLGHSRVAELTSIAPIVVVKKGALGATVLLRSDPVQSFDVPTPPLAVVDTTGAGDAFVAGFLKVWLRRGEGTETPLGVLAAAVRSGHRTAARELVEPRSELPIGASSVKRTDLFANAAVRRERA